MSLLILEQDDPVIKIIPINEQLETLDAKILSLRGTLTALGLQLKRASKDANSRRKNTRTGGIARARSARTRIVDFNKQLALVITERDNLFEKLQADVIAQSNQILEFAQEEINQVALDDFFTTENKKKLIPLIILGLLAL